MATSLVPNKPALPELAAEHTRFWLGLWTDYLKQAYWQDDIGVMAQARFRAGLVQLAHLMTHRPVRVEYAKGTPAAGVSEDRRQADVIYLRPIAKPDEIRFAEALPKTRSGKIMRRLLREMVTSGTTSGDTSTLEDFSVLEKLRLDEE